MYIAWLALSGMLCSLQLSAGSFPRPLSQKEESVYLERAAKGLGARVIYRDVREDDDRGRWSDRHSPSKMAEVLRELARERAQERSTGVADV